MVPCRPHAVTQPPVCDQTPEIRLRSHLAPQSRSSPLRAADHAHTRCMRPWSAALRGQCPRGSEAAAEAECGSERFRVGIPDTGRTERTGTGDLEASGRGGGSGVLSRKVAVSGAVSGWAAVRCGGQGSRVRSATRGRVRAWPGAPVDLGAEAGVPVHGAPGAGAALAPRRRQKVAESIAPAPPSRVRIRLMLAAVSVSRGRKVVGLGRSRGVRYDDFI
jgi:hypothetical protein